MKKALVLGIMAIFAINIANAQTGNRSTSQSVQVKKMEKTTKGEVPAAEASKTTSEQGVAATNNVSNKPLQMTTTSNTGAVQTTTTAAGKTTLGTSTVSPSATNNTKNTPVQMTGKNKPGEAVGAQLEGRDNEAKTTLEAASKSKSKLSLKPQTIKDQTKDAGKPKTTRTQH